MKNLSLLLSICLFSINVIAQDINYYFEQFTHEYANLTNEISLNNDTIWDDPEYTIDLGFDFHILNQPTNYLQFADLGGSLVDTSFTYFIFATTSDLSDRSFNTEDSVSVSPISYKIEAGDNGKICKIEWENAGFYEDEEGIYYTNFQLWLYEGSDMIEIHYGPSFVDPIHYAWEEDACAILEMDNETETATGYLLEEGEDSYEFGFQNLDDFYEPSTFTSIPEEGTVFRFYPENAIEVEEKVNPIVQIFPNPTSDFLTVNTASSSKITYQITAIDGRIILDGVLKGNAKINLKSLNPGSYFISGTLNNQVFTKHFVKE